MVERARRDPDPEYGPSGYLPERAAKRARKIVLRAPLGLQWVVASAAVGIVLLVVMVALVVRATAPPGPPWVGVGPAGAVGDATYDEARGVLLVGAAGRLRAFVVPDGEPPRYCPASGHLESSDGHVWTVTGRALAGGTSLDRRPTMVHRGTLYLDPTRRLAGPPARDTGAVPVCA
ncbi:MAG TPA: hypothetical protein VHF25_15865 [Nitriliruptorales bacterium]|nr:hypothetical protein [Nitriliruptorales bacterium]